jgi:hypothetical protein
MVALALFTGHSYTFAKDPRPKGSNCNLESPPATSGEEAHMGTKLLVYPRAKDITTTYTGCQSLWWTGPNQEVKLVLLVYVEAGFPVRTWANSPQDERGEDCRYKNGKTVSAKPEQCTESEYVLLKSLPSGCFKRIQEAMATKSPHPPDCEYE